MPVSRFKPRKQPPYRRPARVHVPGIGEIEIDAACRCGRQISENDFERHYAQTRAFCTCGVRTAAIPHPRRRHDTDEDN